MLLRPHEDQVLQVGVGGRGQAPALAGLGLGDQLADDLDIVHIAPGVDDAQRGHVALLQHVVQLVALVGRVHGHQHDAGLGGGEHEGQPVRDVARPDPQMVAGLHADGQQPLGQVVGALVKVAVAPAQVAIRVDDEVLLGCGRHLVGEVGADGLLAVQRVAGVARDWGLGIGGALASWLGLDGFLVVCSYCAHHAPIPCLTRSLSAGRKRIAHSIPQNPALRSARKPLFARNPPFMQEKATFGCCPKQE